MTKAVGVAAVALVVTVALIVVVARGRHGTAKPVPAATSTTLDAAALADRDAATAWKTAAGTAFGGSGLPTMLTDFEQHYQAWKSGKEPDAVFRAAETAHLITMARARDMVVALPAFPGDALVGRLYDSSAQLYVEWFRLVLDEADVGAGPARDQLDLLARRVQELGNRVFDRGTALLDVHLRPPPPDPNVIQKFPEEVPQWVAEGLAAGPPLDSPPAPKAAFPPDRSPTRPTEDRARWVGAVARLGVPAPATVGAAVASADPAGAGTGADPGAAKSVAERLISAVEALRSEPDPRPAAPGRPVGEGREESARVRLGLEIDADAARAAQLGAVLAADGSAPGVPGRLVASGRRLLVIGADPSLWSSDLGPHDSGLAPSLLSGNAA